MSLFKFKKCPVKEKPVYLTLLERTRQKYSSRFYDTPSQEYAITQFKLVHDKKEHSDESLIGSRSGPNYVIWTAEFLNL